MREKSFTSPDRSLPDDMSPVWLMLADTGAEAGGPVVPIVCALPTDEKPWRSALQVSVERMLKTRTTLIVPLERTGARAVLSLLAHGRLEIRKAPSLRTVRKTIRALGGEIQDAYVLWPNARAPRLAYPKGKRQLVTWAQRSGVLGGGGNRLWARSAARSVLFTPLAAVLSPGLALVVRGRDVPA